MAWGPSSGHGEGEDAPWFISYAFKEPATFVAHLYEGEDIMRHGPRPAIALAAILGVLVALALVLAGGAFATSASSATATTPSGWTITPTGRTVTVPEGQQGLPGPWGVALSPNGRYALVTSSGEAVQYETTELFDVHHMVRTSLQTYDGMQGQSVFYGVVFSPDGTRAWASGASQNCLHTYDVTADGKLVPTGDIPAGVFPAGVAYGHTPLGDRLYVVNNLSAINPNGYEDPPGHTVTVIDPSSGQITATIDLGTPLFPLDVAFSNDGTRAYVTNLSGRDVIVIDTKTQKVIDDILLSPQSDPLKADHPTGIAVNPVNDEVYAANANSDTVSVIDGKTDALAATIDVSLVPGAPKGSMPVALTVSPDGKKLYVAEAGENAIAVVDLASRTVLGFIPTAWYPADVKLTPNGRRLIVVCTYGMGGHPNLAGPFVPVANYPNSTGSPLPPPYFYPGNWYIPPLSETQYVGTMMKGVVEKISLPDSHASGKAKLVHWTRQVLDNNDARSRQPAEPAALHAIKHVIYVIKENRTYDQVFGTLGKGNGDPALDLYDDSSAPNQRALARQFVLLDNFDVDAAISQDGHPWSTAATATDFVEKVWPFDYADIYSRSFNSDFVPLAQQFPSEPLQSDPTITRSAVAATVGYLWDDAYNHGVSYRDYGEMVANGANGYYSDMTHLQTKFGAPVDPSYVGWNMGIPDHTVREPEWQKEFDQFVKNGNLPALEIVRLPNDHSQGMNPGKATPASYMADNDLALGNLVQAVSHSPYWSSTVICVLEDDAQDGADHVDPHRSPALVISPYTQHATIDSTHYDTAAMLATIEHLLGLAPMSIYDQRALPMWKAFSSTPNMTPWTTIQPTVVPFGDSGYPVNTANTALARACAKMNFKQADAVDDDVMRAAIWQSFHLGKTSSPATQHLHRLGLMR